MQPDSEPVLASLYWIQRRADGGVTIADSRGRTLAGELTPDAASLLALLNDGTAPVTANLRPNGGRDVSLEVWPIPDANDGAFAVETEVCDHLLSRPLEHLVNQVAHDVRNYAFTIGLQAELGMRRTAGLPDVSGHFEAVLRQIDVLKVYLEQLLLFGRPVACSPVPVDVLPWIREQVQTFRFAWEGSSSPLSITVDALEDPGKAHWDRRVLGPALRALLDNAAGSADPPPEVRVVLDSGPERVNVRVNDRGPGISPEVLAQIGRPMASRRPGHPGLGLAIARKMVLVHGGQLRIDSSPDGTTVLLSLPREVRAG